VIWHCFYEIARRRPKRGTRAVEARMLDQEKSTISCRAGLDRVLFFRKAEKPDWRFRSARDLQEDCVVMGSPLRGTIGRSLERPSFDGLRRRGNPGIVGRRASSPIAWLALGALQPNAACSKEGNDSEMAPANFEIAKNQLRSDAQGSRSLVEKSCVKAHLSN
jgi:hypothetical protein